MEMACFVTGVTTRAHCQKSSESARSSFGAVLAIAASDVRRRRAKSARLVVGTFVGLRRVDLGDGCGT